MKRFLLLFLLANVAFAAEDQVIELSIRDHKFYPEVITAKAGSKIKLLVKNEDNSVEEFESFDLKRERIIPAKSSAKVVVGPLKAGEYKFFGEFHEDTAQGILKVE